MVISRITGLLQKLEQQCVNPETNLLSPNTQRQVRVKFIYYSPPVLSEEEKRQGKDKEQESHMQSLIKETAILVADPLLVCRALLADSYPTLKWMQSTWAGVDSFFRVLSEKQSSMGPTSWQPSFVMTRLGGVFGKPMAEYVFAYILSRERQLPALAQYQQTRQWVGRDEGYLYRPLGVLTLGIMGLGDIGHELARVAIAFGMSVCALVQNKSKRRSNSINNEQNETGHEELFSQIKMYESAKENEFYEFLGQCDYVVNCMPSTPQTRKLLGMKEFAKFKRGAVFMNVGRGDVINDEDGHDHEEGGQVEEGRTLMQALDNGWIDGAVIDVLRREPLPQSSRLWSHPKVVITPHVAAISLADDAARLFKENLVRYLLGQQLKFVVDWEKGY